MKIRNGFVSNSSSSSFIVGYKTITAKYGDKYDLDSLKTIKSSCIKNKITVPSDIEVLERKAGKKLELITKDDVYEIKEEVEIPTLKHLEDVIVFNVKDIPKGVEVIECSFTYD